MSRSHLNRVALQQCGVVAGYCLLQGLLIVVGFSGFFYRKVVRMSIFGFGSKTINLENEQFHIEFWTKFKKHLSNSESKLIPFDNFPDIGRAADGKLYSFFGCFLGSKKMTERPSIWLSASIMPEKDTDNVSARLSINCERSQNHRTLFEKLKSHQSDIEALFDYEFGCFSGKVGSSGIYNTVDFSDSKHYEDIFNWIIDSLERVESVLSGEIISYYLNDEL